MSSRASPFVTWLSMISAVEDQSLSKLIHVCYLYGTSTQAGVQHCHRLMVHIDHVSEKTQACVRLALWTLNTKSASRYVEVYSLL